MKDPNILRDFWKEKVKNNYHIDIRVTNLSFISTATQIISPNYQRDYVWNFKLITNLLQDIWDNFESKKITYLNTIHAYSPAGNNDHIIIDGQQRILTYLLIHKIFDCRRAGYYGGDYNNIKISTYATKLTVKKIIKNYYLCQYLQKNTIDPAIKPEIKLIKEWKSKIFNNVEEKNREFKIYLEEGIKVFLVTNSDEDFNLFDKLNSSQKPLELNELCESFLISKIETQKKHTKDKFQKYYERLHDFFSNENIKIKLKDFYKTWIVINSKKEKISDHYSEFKKIFNENDFDIVLNKIDEYVKKIVKFFNNSNDFFIFYTTIRGLGQETYWPLINSIDNDQWKNIVKFDLIKNLFIDFGGQNNPKTFIIRLAKRKENGNMTGAGIINSLFEKYIIKKQDNIFQKTENTYSLNIDKALTISTLSDQNKAEIKIFYKILYYPTEIKTLTKDKLTMFLKSTIEHIIARKSKYNYEGEKENLINLIPLNSIPNSEIQNKSLEEKAYILSSKSDEYKCGELTNVFKDMIDTIKESTGNPYNFIKFRKKKIIDLYNENHSILKMFEIDVYISHRTESTINTKKINNKLIPNILENTKYKIIEKINPRIYNTLAGFIYINILRQTGENEKTRRVDFYGHKKTDKEYVKKIDYFFAISQHLGKTFLIRIAKPNKIEENTSIKPSIKSILGNDEYLYNLKNNDEFSIYKLLKKENWTVQDKLRICIFIKANKIISKNIKQNISTFKKWINYEDRSFENRHLSQTALIAQFMHYFKKPPYRKLHDDQFYPKYKNLSIKELKKKIKTTYKNTF